VELLLARLLGCKRLELPLAFDRTVSNAQAEAMRRGIKRVASGEPVQYVLGQTDFMGHTFLVDKRALIPRPETEVLVREVLACKDLWAQERPAILDLGTGSGCVVISLAREHPEAWYVGLDPSIEALSLARENAVALGVADGVAFSEGDVADVVEPETLDAVVANLPYVTRSEVDALPVHIREHEPRGALDGGVDGLVVLRDAIPDAAIVLKPGGRLFLEIGASQAAAVSALLQENGYIDIRVVRDLAGHDRVMVATIG
jgi:release factor glutamine methyltransferase